jgi:hypothetical protein
MRQDVIKTFIIPLAAIAAIVFILTAVSATAFQDIFYDIIYVICLLAITYPRILYLCQTLSSILG